ncbi:MAG: MFS transporter, partial [Betaproteobacteria bacterium]|nr:MFS transporter [Betaproteobacteria bacterium]
MYAAYGVASPFLPAFYASRGVPAAQLGFALGAATLLRLAMAPLAARAADRLQSLRRVLAACIAAGSAATSAYTAAGSAAAMIALLLLQAAALAPMTLLADALALGHARPRKASGFEYGWVRGAGSAAFIAGTLAAGQAIAARGLDAVPWMQAALLAVAVAAAFAVPEIAHAADARGALAVRGAKALLRVPEIAFAVLAAALVLGSHAMHDAFAMIRWREAGLAPFLSSVLWSEAVAAEVVVFFLAGPRLVARLRPSGAMLVAALAATIRWGVMASTAEPFFLAL